jgi:hypothetical protein
MGSGRFKRQTITHIEQGYYHPSEGFRSGRVPSYYTPDREWHPTRDATVSHAHRARDYAPEYPSDYRRREVPARDAVSNDYVAPYPSQHPPPRRPREAVEEVPSRRREKGGEAYEYYRDHPEQPNSDHHSGRLSSSSSFSSSSGGSSERDGGRRRKKSERSRGRDVRRDNQAEPEPRALRKQFEKECPGFDWTEGLVLALTALGTVASVDKILKHVDKE